MKQSLRALFAVFGSTMLLLGPGQSIAGGKGKGGSPPLKIHEVYACLDDYDLTLRVDFKATPPPHYPVIDVFANVVGDASCGPVCHDESTCHEECDAVTVCDEECDAVTVCDEECDTVTVCEEECDEQIGCDEQLGQCDDEPVCTEVCYDEPVCNEVCYDEPVCNEVCYDEPVCSEVCIDETVCVDTSEYFEECTDVCPAANYHGNRYSTKLDLLSLGPGICDGFEGLGVAAAEVVIAGEPFFFDFVPYCD